MSADQPAWLVISPGRTGTSVHCVGFTSRTSASRSRPRVAFDVELDRPLERAKQRGDFDDVGRRDVTRIGPRMNGDARHSRVDADANGIQDGRNRAAARVPKSGDFVDVD